MASTTGPCRTTALDSSGNYRTATLAGASGRLPAATAASVSLNGTSSEVDPPTLGTFYKTGFTLEAWVYQQTTKVDAADRRTWTSGQNGGPMIWIDHLTATIA